jgi:hypothetical protein
MTFKDPMWLPDKKAIIIGIALENEIEHFPFVASSKDCEAAGRNIYQRAINGEFGEIEEFYDRTQYVVFRKNNSFHFKPFDYFSNIAGCLEKDTPYWIMTPEAYNAIKDYPIETWEIEGEPDGYGTIGEEEIDAANENNRKPGQTAGTEDHGSESQEGPDTPGDSGSIEQPLVGDDDRGTEG